MLRFDFGRDIVRGGVFSEKYRAVLAFSDAFTTDQLTVSQFYKVGVENGSFPHFSPHLSDGVTSITACFTYVNVRRRIRSEAPRKSDR